MTDLRSREQPVALDEPPEAPIEAACAGALVGLPRLSQPLLRQLMEHRGAEVCFREIRAGRAMRLLSAARLPPRRLDQLKSVVPSWPGALPEDPLSALASWASEGFAPVLVSRLRAGEVLSAHPQAPGVLFRSRPEVERSPASARVCIVGTRSCTHYGQSVAADLAGTLAAAGVEILSGIEAGIEASASAGALAGSSRSGRPPAAVVPGGLRRALSGGGELVRRLSAEGSIYSEAPPGAVAERWRYFRRSVLLALLADVVVVVEAHRRSGALAVAELAAEAGVCVGAVPGSVRSSASAGTNALLSEGAHVVRGADDVLTLLDMSGAPGPPRGLPTPAAERATSLPPAAARVHSCLEDTPVTLELVVLRSGLALGEVAGALEILVACGLARRAGGCFELA